MPEISLKYIGPETNEQLQDSIHKMISDPDFVPPKSSDGNRTLKTCLVNDCKWAFDCTNQSLRATERAIANHMIDHTPRKLFETINSLRYRWLPFESSDESTHPDEDVTYVVIAGDDMMQVLAGRLNYFNRAKVAYYIPLPPFPKEALDAE